MTKWTGWQQADPIGALAISAYMLWNAQRIAKAALVQLLDRELPGEDRRRIRKAILGCEGACNIHDLRTRYSGDRIFVEYHLEVDGNLTVARGHAIGDNTESAVERLFSDMVEVTAHLEPFGIIDERLDDRVRQGASA